MLHSVPRVSSLIAFLALLASCAPRPSVYLPSAPVTPLLAKQGDLRFTVSANSASNITGEVDGFSSLEAAYALTKNIGIIGHASYSPTSHGSLSTSPSRGYAKDVGLSYGELGAGYFKTFDKYGRFEAYAGVGIGNTDTKFLDSAGDITGWYGIPYYYGQYVQQHASFVRPFIQGTVGAEGEVAAFAFTLRVSSLTMKRLAIDSMSWTNEPIDTVNYRRVVSDTSYTMPYSGLFLEPGFALRVGYKQIKFDMRLWWSNPIANRPQFYWSNTSFSGGLSFDFDLLPRRDSSF